jgi:hypothetical protein
MTPLPPSPFIESALPIAGKATAVVSTAPVSSAAVAANLNGDAVVDDPAAPSGGEPGGPSLAAAATFPECPDIPAFLRRVR